MKRVIVLLRLLVLLVIVFQADFSVQAQTVSVASKIYHNSTTGTSYNGTVNYSVEISTGWVPGATFVTTMSLKDVVSGAIVYTHSGTTIPYGTISNLPPGIYQFIGNASVIVGGRSTPLTISDFIWVGYRAAWEQSYDMQESVAQSSTKRFMKTSGQNYSYAQSFNMMSSTTADCWIEMKKKYATTNNDSRIYWVLEPLANPSAFDPANNIAYIEFKTTNTGTTIKIKCKAAGSATYTVAQFSTNPNDKVRLVRSGSSTSIQLNNSTANILPTYFPSGIVNITGNLKVTVLAKEIGDEAFEIATSFGYPSANLPVSYTYNSTTQVGQIVNRINPISGIGITAPYHYLVSQKELPVYSTYYRTMKDSLFGGVLDSAKFFQGNVAATSFTHNDLPPGNYFLGVYDSKGRRIYSNNLALNPLTAESNIGTSRFDNTFTCAQNSSTFITDNYLSEEDSWAELVYYPLNTTNQSYFGLMNTSSSLTSTANIQYGFNINAGSIYLIQAGVVGTTAYAVKESSEVKLLKNDGSLEFWVDGVLRGTNTLPTTFTYKTGMAMTKWGMQTIFKPFGLKKKQLKRKITTELGSCLGSFGKVSVTLLPISTPAYTMSNFNVTLKNASNVLQTLDAGSTSTSYSFSNLVPGTYTVTTTYTLSVGGNQTIIDIVYVDSKLSWDYHNETSYSDVDRSLVKSSNSPNQVFGNSTSTNKIGSGSNYVDFNVSGPFSIVKHALVWTNPISVPIPLAPSVSGYGLLFSKVGSFYSIQKQDGTIVANFLTSNRFRYVYDASAQTESLYRLLPDGSLGSLVYGPIMIGSATNLTAYVGKNNYLFSGFYKMSTNIPCSTTAIYAKLERQLTGTKYKVYLNKFYFFYDEEYASTASLSYKVYDKNNTVVLSTSTQVLTQTVGAVNREYGDNRYSLDVNNIDPGAYILEVTNEKGEKFYLRFVK
jgi:hypothetical protein